jgi:hypothetical protein
VAYGFPLTLPSDHEKNRIANENTLKLSRSIEMLWEEILLVEAQEGWKYDYMIFLRDDAMWFHDFIIERPILRYPNKQAFLTACDARKPRMHPAEACDFFAMADRKSSVVFGKHFSLFLSEPVLECTRPGHADPGCNSEMLLKWMIRRMNVSVGMLNQMVVPFQRAGYIVNKKTGNVEPCFHKHCQSIIEPMLDPIGMQSCSRVEPGFEVPGPCQ